MKKVLIFIFMFVSICSMAQGHMKFMGISMGISINSFQQQLAKKNVRVSRYNASAPSGQRIFEGMFSGKQADIVLWYNERTKAVYRGKAVIESSGKDLAIQNLNGMESKLDIKYGTDCKTEDTYDDDYGHSIRSVHYDTGNGTIDLFIIGQGYTDTDDFYLHIDYHDASSTVEKTIDEMDDL